MVGRSFRSGVWGVRGVWRFLCEISLIAQAAVDFVGRYVQEPEPAFALFVKRFIISASRREHRESAVYVRLNKGGRAVDGAVYVAFRRKVEDCVNAVSAQRLINKLRVADVALDECEFIQRNAVKRRRIARIGQLVVDDCEMSLRREEVRQVAPYKTGRAGDQKYFCLHQASPLFR